MEFHTSHVPNFEELGFKVGLPFVGYKYSVSNFNPRGRFGKVWNFHLWLELENEQIYPIKEFMQ
jgi:hypothetical protein